MTSNFYNINKKCYIKNWQMNTNKNYIQKKWQVYFIKTLSTNKKWQVILTIKTKNVKKEKAATQFCEIRLKQTDIKMMLRSILQCNLKCLSICPLLKWRTFIALICTSTGQ